MECHVWSWSSPAYVMRCHVLHARSSYAVAVSGMKPPGCRSPLPVRGQAAASRGRARPPEVPDRRAAPSGMTPKGQSSPRPPPVPAPSGEAGALCGWHGGVRPGRGRPPAASIAASPRIGVRGRPGRGSVAVIVSPFATGSGTLFRAYPARARARVGAGAVRAPDCAREAEGARLPSASRGFSKMAPPGRAAPGKRLRIPLPRGPSYHNPPDVKLI